jgi:hypothetical protein
VALEALVSIKRAGADGILTYFAKRAAEWLGRESAARGRAGRSIRGGRTPGRAQLVAVHSRDVREGRRAEPGLSAVRHHPDDFRRETLRLLTGGVRGLNVTLPHKQAAAELVNELTPRAARAQAVNTIAFFEDATLLGDNTDGVGLIRDLEHNLSMRSPTSAC